MGLFNIIKRTAKVGSATVRFAAKEVRERVGRKPLEQAPTVSALEKAPSDIATTDVATPDNDMTDIAITDEVVKKVGMTDSFEVDRRLDSGEPFVLLDCRELHEWEAGYIGGCTHIPMNELPDRVSELDSSIPTIVYCLHGMRSAEVAGWLGAKMGFDDVSSLDGGIVAWYSDFDQARIVVSRSEDH